MIEKQASKRLLPRDFVLWREELDDDKRAVAKKRRRERINNRIKSVLFVVAVCVLVGCAGLFFFWQPSKSESPDTFGGFGGPIDMAFVNVLKENDIPYTTSIDAMLIGRGVCLFLDDGHTLESATQAVMDASGLNPDQSGFVVRAAIDTYCPKNAKPVQ